jgi:hypothetical protein
LTRVGAFGNGGRDGDVAGDRCPVQLVDLLALPRKFVLDALVQLEQLAAQFAGLGLLRRRFPGRLGWGGKVTAPLLWRSCPSEATTSASFFRYSSTSAGQIGAAEGSGLGASMPG